MPRVFSYNERFVLDWLGFCLRDPFEPLEPEPSSQPSLSFAHQFPDGQKALRACAPDNFGTAAQAAAAAEATNAN